MYSDVRKSVRAAVIGLMFVTAGGAAVLAQEITFFRIGTGSTAGTYFPVGSLLASIISNPPGSRPCDEGGSCGVPGLIAVAQTTEGSVENVTAVSQGTLESGLAQSDVIYWAYSGKGSFSGTAPLSKLRVIANLYPESIHLVVRKGTGITSVRGLKGKRVSLGLSGSGTHVDALIILSAYGLKKKDVAAIDVRPGRAMSMLLAGDLDALFFVGGYPAVGISYLAARGAINLLPLVGPEAATVRKRDRFFSQDTIPSGIYEGVGEVKTLSVNAQWVVSADADEDLIYEIVKALWHPRNRTLLESGHAKGRLVRLKSALDGVSIPLHPGAERYYREVGLIR